MKKIILLLITMFLLTACGDYKEVNDLAIVNSIGVDYQNNNFVVTLEVLNSKVDKESGKIYSYARTGQGKNIAKAVEKAADTLSYRPYYSHIKLKIISKEVAENHLDQIIDYFIRNTYFRENSYLLVAKDKSPKELLSIVSKENPIPGQAMIDLLKNNSYASNIAVNKKFTPFLTEILAFGLDGSISVVNLQDKKFYIDGLAIFKDKKMVNILDNNDALIFNLLSTSKNKPLFNIKVNNQNLSIVIYNAKTKFKVEPSTINILGAYHAKIYSNEGNLNLNSTKVLKKIAQKASIHLDKLIYDFVKKIQENDSDILGLAQKYYLKTRDKNNNLWQHAHINSNIKVIIDKKGLAYIEYENH